MGLTTRRCTGYFCGLLTLGAPAAAVVTVTLPARPARAQVEAVDAPAEKAAEQAADRRPVEERIADAVRDLGADDFRVREKAGDVLWSLGDAAVPALKEAAASDDPEVARRARAVLDKFAYGIRPDTPKPVMQLLEQYTTGNAQQKQAAAQALAALELPGPKVLLQLCRDERDEGMRRMAVHALAKTSRPVAAKLMAAGDFDTARLLLQTCAPTGDAATRDYAAFLLLRGGIDEEIARLEAERKALGIDAAPAGPQAPAVAPVPVRPPDRVEPGGAGPPMRRVRAPGPPDPRELSVQLAFLYRAKGDLAAARRAAEKLSDPRLPDALLVEAGDWDVLAAQMEQRNVSPASIEEMGRVTAYHRLAGNQEAVAKWTAKIVEFGRNNPAGHWDAAEALLLNDRPDLAIEVLLHNKNYRAAADFLIPRLQFREALDLLEKAKADVNADNLPSLRLRTADALHSLGRTAEAREMVTAIANERDDGNWDFDTYLQILHAARACGIAKEQIDAWCAAAASVYRPQRVLHDALPRLFDRAGFERPEEAAAWWRALRDQHGGEPPKQTVARLRKIDRRELPPAELRELCDAALGVASALPPPERDPRAILVADTLSAAGLTEPAIAALSVLVRRNPTPPVLVRLGDLYAANKEWGKAADTYKKAADQDRTNPLPLLLRGWALVHGGKEKEGRELMELAHLVPLADEEVRAEFAQQLGQRGHKELSEHASRERALYLKTCQPGTFGQGDVYRRTALELNARGDALAAAAAWDRSLLTNLSTKTQFIEPGANLMIPVAVHRLRALGLVKAGRIDEAVKEAKLCFRNCPGDSDTQIAIVLALQNAGRQAEADALYQQAKDLYYSLAKASPDSAPANNLLAWLQSTCRRDLDEALAHARRAAELEPESTAVLDTLSEVYFARGEFDQALELNEKIRKLAPTDEHHRRNFERFKAAREQGGAATTRPSPAI